MRIAFILEAIPAARIANARVCPVSCDDSIRSARMAGDREQPELANAEMMNWAGYLRGEAMAADTEILDTGTKPWHECAERIRKWFEEDR